jgi:hypothetical protein
MSKKYTKTQIINKLNKELIKIKKCTDAQSKIHNIAIDTVSIFELSNIRVYIREIEKKVTKFQKLLDNKLKIR